MINEKSIEQFDNDELKVLCKNLLTKNSFGFEFSISNFKKKDLLSSMCGFKDPIMLISNNILNKLLKKGLNKNEFPIIAVKHLNDYIFVLDKSTINNKEFAFRELIIYSVVERKCEFEFRLEEDFE